MLLTKNIWKLYIEFWSILKHLQEKDYFSKKYETRSLEGFMDVDLAGSIDDRQLQAIAPFYGATWKQIVVARSSAKGGISCYC